MYNTYSYNNNTYIHVLLILINVIMNKLMGIILRIFNHHYNDYNNDYYNLTILVLGIYIVYVTLTVNPPNIILYNMIIYARITLLFTVKSKHYSEFEMYI